LWGGTRLRLAQLFQRQPVPRGVLGEGWECLGSVFLETMRNPRVETMNPHCQVSPARFGGETQAVGSEPDSTGQRCRIRRIWRGPASSRRQKAIRQDGVPQPQIRSEPRIEATVPAWRESRSRQRFPRRWACQSGGSWNSVRPAVSRARGGQRRRRGGGESGPGLDLSVDRNQPARIFSRSSFRPILRYRVAMLTPSMLAVFSREPSLYLRVSRMKIFSCFLMYSESFDPIGR